MTKVTVRHKIVVMLELLGLLLLTFNVFRSCYHVSFSAADVKESNQSLVLEEDTYATVYNNNGSTVFFYEFGKLSSGAYDVRITYNSDFYYENDNVAETEFDLIKTVGVFEVYSERIPEGISCEKLALRDGTEEVNTTFWVEPFYRMYDIKGEITFYGYGKLGIESIQITEKRIYRVIYLLCYLLFIFIADFVYLVITNRIFQKHKKIILAMLGLGILCNLLITLDGVGMCDDTYFHLNRLVSLASGLKNGQFPNRIQQELLYGYSYITPVFYGEIFLYFPAVLINMGVKVQTALDIYNIMVNLATLLLAYGCFRKIFDDKAVGLIGAMAYTFAPYRMVDMYSRMALGEYSAWAFLPLVVYGFYKIYQERDKITVAEWFPLTLGMTGLIQTHILTCEMVMVFIIAFVCIFWKKTIKKGRWFVLLKAAGATGLLNIWFIYPFIDSMSMELNVFENVPDLIEERGLELTDILSLVVKPSGRYILGGYFIIGVVVLAMYAWQKREQAALIINGRYDILSKVFAGFTIVAVLFTLKIFPYDRIASYSNKLMRIICMIQFPWRFLMFASLFGALALCCSLVVSKEWNQLWGQKYHRILVMIISASYLISCAQYASTDTRQIYTINETCIDNIGNPEYAFVNTDIEQIYDTSIKTTNVSVDDSIFKNGIYQYSVNNKSDETGIMLLPIFDYDNYIVYTQDGTELEHVTGENNRIQVNIPAGYDGTVFVEYSVPVAWRVADWVSLLTLGTYLLYFYRRLKKKGCNCEQI